MSNEQTSNEQTSTETGAIAVHPAGLRQQYILWNIIAYLIILAVALSVGNTVLLAAAVSIFLVAPISIGLYAARGRTFGQIRATLGTVLRYVVIALSLATAALYVVTDVWNPDKFSYQFGEPTLMQKLLVLLKLELPWAISGLALGWLASIAVGLIRRRQA